MNNKQTVLFSELGLNGALVDAVQQQGYDSPTPIQAAAIPAILKGLDVMAAAQTGTGKTAGFTLPLLHRLHLGQAAGAKKPRALILTPTRELAAQVTDSVVNYGANLALRSAVVFGGVGIQPQIKKLQRGVDVLVATPGRLLDLHQQRAVDFSALETLVLDEADRMLDMGFIHDIRRIIKLLPTQRQTLMFSATFSDEIRQLARGLLNRPEEISVTPPNSTVKSVRQWIHPVDKKNKSNVLADLLHTHQWPQVLVFTRTKHGANRLTQQLAKRELPAAAIHGNKSQSARTRALADFKKGKIQVLVATDIAARGIDIHELPQVVNFDLPNVAEDYVHRIGRTGRAGRDGEAMSLVSADEHKQLLAIERLIGRVLPREYVDGHEPVHELPASKTAVQNAPKKSNNNGRRKNRKPTGQKPNAQAHNRSRNGQAPRRNKRNRRRQKTAAAG